MRNLLDFLLKYSSIFVFTFLFVISGVLLVSNGRFHSSVWFTSANAVSNKVYGIGNGITGYFNLRSINDSLQRSNSELQKEVLNLREEIKAYRAIIGDTVSVAPINRYDYVLATVLKNSVRHPRNYFTINKGSADGIKAGMGVADQNGIVGIVNIAGPNTSRIISLLNTTQHISVRLKGTNTVGSLVWKVNDPKIAYMEEVARHTTFAIGDTVVTSGFSSAFPKDLPVGVVIGKVRSENDNFFVLKVRLASDFNTLSSVRVIMDDLQEEMDSLENYDIKTE